MRKLVAMAVAAPLLGFTLACSGLGGSYDNVTPCKAYVKKQNSLRCMKDAQLNEDDICPEQLNMTPKDMGPYYECLAENAKCKGKVPDLGGQASCSP